LARCGGELRRVGIMSRDLLVRSPLVTSMGIVSDIWSVFQVRRVVSDVPRCKFRVGFLRYGHANRNVFF
jgi:hypothetical protein